MTTPIDIAAFVERGKHDKEGRQRALVDAATAVFATAGYDAATTREVAARAGCSEGLIHRYFGGKRGLLFAVLEQRSERVFQRLQELPLEANLIADLSRLFHYSLDCMWEDQDAIRVTIGQAINDPEVGAFVGERFSDMRVRATIDRLERHRAAGNVAASVDLAAAAMAITGVSFSASFMLQLVFAIDRDELRARLDAIAVLLARALAPAPAGD